MLAGALVACGGNETTTPNENSNVQVMKKGELTYGGVSQEESKKILMDVVGKPEDGVSKDMGSEENPHGVMPENGNVEVEWFDDLNTMLAAFESGRIVSMDVPSLTAKYITSKNNSLIQLDTQEVIPYAMLLKSDNTELRDRINVAIEEIQKKEKERTMIQNMENPQKVEFKHFDGAETIRFAVTGDLPPMDYVSESGQAMGFNVSLIAAICEEMKVNAEIVQITTGARAMALETGKADVVFWTKAVIEGSYLEIVSAGVPKEDTNYDEMAKGFAAMYKEDGTVDRERIERANALNKMDQPQNTILTIPYFIDVLSFVEKNAEGKK